MEPSIVFAAQVGPMLLSGEEFKLVQVQLAACRGLTLIAYRIELNHGILIYFTSEFTE
jgi:hypothetical protein